MSSLGGVGIILVTSLRLKCDINDGSVRGVISEVGGRTPSLIILTKSVFSGRCRTLSSPRCLSRALRRVRDGCKACTICKGRSIGRALVTKFSVNTSGGTLHSPEASRFVRGTKVAILRSRTRLVSRGFCLIKELSKRGGKQNASGQGSVRRLATSLSRAGPLFMVGRRPSRLERCSGTNMSMLFSKRARTKRFFPLAVIRPFT